MEISQLNITKPALIIDKQRAIKNIKLMAEKAKVNDVRFRPHFKTHQSAEISNWFKEVGVDTIAVSSVDMADYFMNCGWGDITIAFPVNIREINHINKLAAKIRLNLLVESCNTVNFLDKSLNYETEVWIKVDTGYQRTGIMWDEHIK